MSLTERLLSPIVQVRTEERTTALLMFAYSFLAMTAYNIVQPLVRSTFISTFGADNVPYVILAAGLLVGLIMQIYGWLVARLPERRALPISLAGMAGLLVAFWLLFQTGQRWVSRSRSISWVSSSGRCSSASSGHWPTTSTIPGRRSGCSGSSAAAPPWAAWPAPG